MKNLFIVFLVGIFFVVVTDAYKLLPLDKSEITIIDNLTEEENEDESETKIEKDDQLMDMEFMEIRMLSFAHKNLKQNIYALIFLNPRFHSAIVSPPPEANRIPYFFRF